MKLGKLKNVLSKVNQHIMQDNITEEFVNEVEKCYKKKLNIYKSVSKFKLKAMKFREKIRMPTKGIYTTKINI